MVNSSKFRRKATKFAECNIVGDVDEKGGDRGSYSG